MQITPMIKGKLLIEIYRSCVFERILQFITHDTIIAAQSAILKYGSFCQSFSRSFGVGLRESRLKSSSRMGKPEQMMPMQRNGLNQLEKSGNPEIIASTKYGAGEFMRLSTQKMSIFFLGSSLQSVAMIQVIFLIEIYDRIMTLVHLYKMTKDVIKVLERDSQKFIGLPNGAYFSLFGLYKIKLMSMLWPKSGESVIDGSDINKCGSFSSIIAFSQLPSSVGTGLEVEEMTITPRRISFSKKRSIIQSQGKSTQDNKAKMNRHDKQSEGMNESNVSATSSIRSKRQKQSQPFEELPLLKNKLLTSKIQALQSGIDLSIISEGKSQSKLVTPQQNKTKAETERKSCEDKRKTTFQRWFDNKNARGVIQSDQFSFSMNEIGDMTINPALHSFYEEPKVSEAIKQRSYSFKEFLNKKEQPLLNDRGVNFEETRSKRLVKLRSLSKEKSKNDIAKRIIQIQNILAMKGVVQSTNTKAITLASLSKPNIPIQKQPIIHDQPQNRVSFDVSFSSSNKSIDPPHSNLLDTSMIIQIS